jgi:hypothetical protein
VIFLFSSAQMLLFSRVIEVPSPGSAVTRFLKLANGMSRFLQNPTDLVSNFDSPLGTKDNRNTVRLISEAEKLIQESK